MWTGRPRFEMNITVKKCLCLELETGGVFIGWLGVALHGFLSAIFAYVIYIMYEERNNQAEKMEKFAENYHLFMHGLIFVFLVSATISSYRCVKATKTRNPKPFIFTTVWWWIYAALSFTYVGYSLRNDDMSGLIGLIGIIVFGYFSIVTNSLQEKFANKDDRTNVGNSRFSEPV